MDALIKPQPRQMDALTSPADILIFGGAAGGGKSFYLLMEALRHIKNPQYGGIIFRRTHPMITQEGGLWDKSCEIYPLAGGNPLHGDRWQFETGATARFCHMQHEKDKYGWNSSQIPFIAFDEMSEFSESMFWYMLSRNRSTCGIRPYMRGACIPDADSWLAELLSWWINQETGFPITDRRGKIRWFARIDEKLEWANSWDELHQRFPDIVMPYKNRKLARKSETRRMPTSLTFIDSLLGDNPILEGKDPEYRHKLMQLPLVERERLLSGNWKIRPASGLKFPRDKWVPVPACPPAGAFLRLVRFWDKAYTEGGSGAKTAGVLMGELRPEFIARGLPRYLVVDCQSGRWGDAAREARIQATAEIDRATFGHVTIGVENEGGAGKQATNATISGLAGFDAYGERPTAKKHLRWTPLATQQQIGNVGIVHGDWDWPDFIRQLDNLAGDEELDKGKLKDAADAAAGAFKGLTGAYFGRDTELLCSGGDDDDHKPLSKKDIEQLPDFLRDIVKTHRGLAEDKAEQNREDKSDWRD